MIILSKVLKQILIYRIYLLDGQIRVPETLCDLNLKVCSRVLYDVVNKNNGNLSELAVMPEMHI